jgi:hypothetical protein
VKIHCLMRQEVQLLSKNSKNVFIYIFQGIHPTSHPASPKTLKHT